MRRKTPAKDRWALLDNLRGLNLVSMIAYHACWDLVYLFGHDWAWYRSLGAFLWQQSICWTFILLSGFCVCLGHRPLRRGLEVSAAGAAVTAVTLAVMPENRILCGVLTLLGACMITTGLLDGWLRRIPAPAGAAGSLLLFLLTRNVNRGYLGFASFHLALPEELYRNLFTAFLGFPPGDFWSTDYFSLLPWLFLFWTGYYLRKGSPERLPSGGRRFPVLAWLGENSLLVYMVHQPAVYGALAVFHWLGAA